MRDRRSWMMTGMAGAIVMIGCNRTRPVAIPAATRPTTATVDATPPESSLLIGGKPCQFRPARILTESGDEGVLVRVYSEGASPEGAQDGYYLEMTVETADDGRLDGATWRYESASNERPEEVTSAITVNGGGNQLLPRDVTVEFHEASDGVFRIQLKGTFNVFKGRDGGASVGVVPVEATLTATRR